MKEAPIPGDSAEAARSQRINDLRAQYQAGNLKVDARVLAAKLIEAHLAQAGQERKKD